MKPEAAAVWPFCIHPITLRFGGRARAGKNARLKQSSASWQRRTRTGIAAEKDDGVVHPANDMPAGWDSITGSVRRLRQTGFINGTFCFLKITFGTTPHPERK